MHYGLVHYPKVDKNRINQIRRKYDPTVDLIEPHIAVMFPVSEAIGEAALVQHIARVLKAWRPFPIRIRGLCKSWDHWLFLTLEEGNAEVIKLHRDIYTGIVAPYRREDIEFIPHIGLGLFVREYGDYDLKHPQQLELDIEKYKTALQEAEAAGLDYNCVLDKLCLVRLRDNFSRIEKSKEFFLG